MTGGTPPLYIGLMSGTSLDGVDGVLARFEHGHPHTLAFAHHPFDSRLRDELVALQAPVAGELARAMTAANCLANAYADVAHELLSRAEVPARAVRAIGAHGQTVRHAPQAEHGGYTVQLLNAARLAERTGIGVVHDLRSRDIAAGGQGAPLVPAFHAELFAVPGHTHVVCNLGGIANITVLPANGVVTGHDCGPGNCLIDLWAHRHLGTAYDAHGEFAAQGTVHAALLRELLDEPYFTLPAPKSTGRELFHAQWLDARLAAHPYLEPADVQATLTELTARCVADDVMRHAPLAEAVWLCGGGAFNRHLSARLQALLPCPVEGTHARGVPEMHVEALAFAWLAMRHLDGLPGNLTSVTGAAGPRVLGSHTPA
ncbi:MAG: anhydro-N-acetylmuramic acid kinase [Betaproteobacteria bacterium]|nr:anhydro-N-acetylmuramic acid kinase [Betaproteobacteria bacterium]